MRLRPASALAVSILAVAVAVPASAWVMSVPGILKRAAERRSALGLVSVEATGTLQADGPSGASVLALGGVRRAGGLATVPARLLWKVPNRCRLELLPPEVPEASRPWLLVKDEAVSGSELLVREPAFVALARALCTTLALPPDPEAPDRPLGVAVARRGVALADAALGRFDGRVSYVLGGRPTDLSRPLAWFDKESFQPTRLLYAESGLSVDVRFLGWGSPNGGDWAPRATEVHAAGALRIRFTTEKATANPKLAEALWQ